MNYKEVIESRYNRQKWQLLLHDIFGNKVDFWENPYAITTNSQLSKQTLWLGTITLSDGETISVYEVELDYRLGSNWYSDRQNPAFFEGKWQGAKTQRKWRKEILEDWARRWYWLENE